MLSHIMSDLFHIYQVFTISSLTLLIAYSPEDCLSFKWMEFCNENDLRKSDNNSF